MATKEPDIVNGLSVPSGSIGPGYVVAFGQTFGAKDELKARGFVWTGNDPILPKGWVLGVDARDPQAIYKKVGHGIPRVQMRMSTYVPAIGRFSSGHWRPHERVELEFSPDEFRFVATPKISMTNLLIREMEKRGWVALSLASDTQFYKLASSATDTVEDIGGFDIRLEKGDQVLVADAVDKSLGEVDLIQGTRDSRGRQIDEYEVRIRNWHKGIDDFDQVGIEDAEKNGVLRKKYYVRPLTQQEFSAGADTIEMPAIDGEVPTIADTSTGEERIAQIGMKWAKINRPVGNPVVKPTKTQPVVSSPNTPEFIIDYSRASFATGEWERAVMLTSIGKVDSNVRVVRVDITPQEFQKIAARLTDPRMIDWNAFPGFSSMLTLFKQVDTGNRAASSGGITLGWQATDGGQKVIGGTFTVRDSKTKNGYLGDLTFDFYSSVSKIGNVHVVYDPQTKTMKDGRFDFYPNQVFDGWRFERCIFPDHNTSFLASFTGCSFDECNIEGDLYVTDGSFATCTFPSVSYPRKTPRSGETPYSRSKFDSCMIARAEITSAKGELPGLVLTKCNISALSPFANQILISSTWDSCMSSINMQIPKLGKGTHLFKDMKIDRIRFGASDSQAKVVILGGNYSVAVNDTGIFWGSISIDGINAQTIEVENVGGVVTIGPNVKAKNIYLGAGEGEYELPPADGFISDLLSEINTLAFATAITRGTANAETGEILPSFSAAIDKDGIDFWRVFNELLINYGIPVLNMNDGVLRIAAGDRSYIIAIYTAGEFFTKQVKVKTAGATESDSLVKALAMLVKTVANIPDPESIIPKPLTKSKFLDIRRRFVQFYVLFGGYK